MRWALSASALIKRHGATRTVIFGFLVSIVAFFAYAFATQGWMVFVIIPFAALGGLLNPALNQIMTSRVSRNAQGELQGTIASVQALGNMFSPIVMTQTLFYFTHSEAPVTFPGAAFVLAGIVTTLSLIPLIIGLRTVPKADPEADNAPQGEPAGEAPPATESVTAR